MYTIIARGMEGNNVIGYIVTDGINKRLLSKDDAWRLAKANQIQSVKAVGNSPEQGLTGINGFELKKLPTEQQDTKIEACVYTAGMYRNLENALNLRDNGLNATDPKFIEFRKQVIKEELCNGVLNKFSLHEDSKNLRLDGFIGITSNSSLNYILEYVSEQEQETIRDALFNKKGTENISKILGNSLKKAIKNQNSQLLKNLESSSIADDVVGYIFTNIGDYPIQYQIVDRDTYNVSYAILNPRQEVSLSRIETVLLMCKPTINFKVSNAVMCSTYLKEKTYWDQLNKCYMAFDKNVTDSLLTDRIMAKRIFVYDLDQSDISRFLTKEQELKFIAKVTGSKLSGDELNKYISNGGSLGIKTTPNTRGTKNNSNISTQKALKDAKGLKGVMDVFKR